MQNADLSVIIPVYNEQENLKELFSRLIISLKNITDNYQIIIVNDGSTDNSNQIISEIIKTNLNVYVINFSRNFGHQIAVSAGLEYSKAKATVIIDADLQDPPELIEKLYKEYLNGYEVVLAKRNKREGESFLKKFTAKWYYRILEKLVHFKLPLDVGDYRLISEKVVNAINTMPEQNKFLRAQIAWLGFKSTEVLYDRSKRSNGKGNYSYAKMFKLAFDGITGFSDRPLRFVSRLGLFISLCSFLIILYAIFSHFVLKQTITGWTSLIISSTFIGGIQLLSIGVIGEYISRINNNVRKRPLYIIESTNIKN